MWSFRGVNLGCGRFFFGDVAEGLALCSKTEAEWILGNLRLLYLHPEEQPDNEKLCGEIAQVFSDASSTGADPVEQVAQWYAGQLKEIFEEAPDSWKIVIGQSIAMGDLSAEAAARVREILGIA